jgi:hypothetical protein
MKPPVVRRDLFRWAGALVVVLIVVLTLPACASKQKPSRIETAESKVDELKLEVRTMVKDPARADRLVGLLDEAVALLTEHSHDLAAQDAQIRAMLVNYGTTPEDLRAAFANYSTARAAHSDRCIKLLEQMRTATTPEEWVELRKMRQKTLQAVMDAARPH